jgi:hypothetical protein
MTAWISLAAKSAAQSITMLMYENSPKSKEILATPSSLGVAGAHISAIFAQKHQFFASP